MDADASAYIFRMIDITPVHYGTRPGFANGSRPPLMDA